MELFSPGMLDLGMLFIKGIWQLDLDSRCVEVFPCFPSNGHTVADDRPPGSVAGGSQLRRNFSRVGAADPSSDILHGGLVFLRRKPTEGEMFTHIRTELDKRKQLAGLVPAPWAPALANWWWQFQEMVWGCSEYFLWQEDEVIFFFLKHLMGIKWLLAYIFSLLLHICFLSEKRSNSSGPLLFAQLGYK